MSPAEWCVSKAKYLATDFPGGRPSWCQRFRVSSAGSRSKKGNRSAPFPWRVPKNRSFWLTAAMDVFHLIRIGLSHFVLTQLNYFFSPLSHFFFNFMLDSNFAFSNSGNYLLMSTTDINPKIKATIFNLWNFSLKNMYAPMELKTTTAILMVGKIFELSQPSILSALIKKYTDP